MAHPAHPQSARIFAASAIGHAIVGLDGTLLDVNDALARLLGYERGDMIGKSLLSFAHPDNQRLDPAVFEQLRSGAVPVATRTRRYLHASGASLWVRFSVIVMRDADGQDVMACGIEDVSEFVAVERHNRLLLEVLAILSDLPDFGAAVGAALERLCLDTPWTMAQLWLPAGDGDVLACAEPSFGASAALGLLRDASMHKAAVRGEGFVGGAWESHRPTSWSTDAGQGHFSRAAAAQACGIRTALAIPLVAYGQATGVVELFSPLHVDEADPAVALVVSVATHLGSTLARRRDEQTLRDSEQRLRAITDGAPVAVVTSDAAGRIVGWNASAQSLFGMDRASVFGRPASALISPALREDVAARIGGLSESGREDIRSLAVTCVRVDGSEFPAEVSVSRWMSLGAPNFTAIFRDVSVQHAVDSDRRLHSERLAAIVDVQNEVLRAAMSVAAVQHLVVERAEALFGCEGAALELLEGTEMVYLAGAGTAFPHIGLRLDAATSLSGKCVRDGEPQVCDDTELDDRVNRDACRRIGVRAMLIVPLFDANSAIGALKVISSVPRSWSDDDVRTLQLLASSIGTAMLNASQHEDAVARADKALYDELTGLPRRELLMDRMRHAHTRMGRNRQATATFFIDLDGFKAINDNFGHAVGDELLVAVATRLNATLRGSDTAARIGGDEFLAFCEDIQGDAEHDEAVRVMAGRLVAALSAPYELSSRSVTVTASMGVAVSSNPDDAPESLILRADEAMYVAKRGGKAQASFAPLPAPPDVEVASAVDGPEVPHARSELHAPTKA